MSLHKRTFPQQEALTESLKSHGLEHDTPSQLADTFRLGWQAFAALSAAQTKADPVAHGLPPYPTGEVVGPCVCGSWPGGKCLRCEVVPAKADERGSAQPAFWAIKEESGLHQCHPDDFGAKPFYAHPARDDKPNFCARCGKRLGSGVHTCSPPRDEAAADEWTPAMSLAVQRKSELGAYAAANLSGAYDLFAEFWRVAMSARPQGGETE